jgi:hypothetical protein
MEANAELVLHNCISPSYLTALSFLKSLIDRPETENIYESYRYAYWLYQLTQYLHESVAIAGHPITWDGWRVWLTPKVSMLWSVTTDTGNETLRHDAQTFLSAWHHLVSDNQECLRK